MPQESDLQKPKLLPEWAELIKQLYEEAMQEQKSVSRKPIEMMT